MAMVAISSSPRRRFWKDRPLPPPKDAASKRKRTNRSAKRCESEVAVRRDRRNSQGKHRQKHPSNNNNNSKDDPGDSVIDLRCHVLHCKESILLPSLVNRSPSHFSGVGTKESVSPPNLVDQSHYCLPILNESVFLLRSMNCSSSRFSVINEESIFLPSLADSSSSQFSVTTKESIFPPPTDCSSSHFSVIATESISLPSLADDLPSCLPILKESISLPSLADCSPSRLPILKESISPPSLADCLPSPHHPVLKESMSSPSLVDCSPCHFSVTPKESVFPPSLGNCSPSSLLPILKGSISRRSSLADRECLSSKSGLSEEAEFSPQRILPGSENHHPPKPSTAIKNSSGLDWKPLLFCEQDPRKTGTPSSSSSSPSSPSSSSSKPTKGGGGGLGHIGPRQYFPSGKTWRPDDSSRPASLPMLPRRINGFSQTTDNAPALPPPPPSCPICAEELDSTDCSFIPCPCQFRLCLFCHHRILLEDGRCPGCRKAYSR